MTAFTATVPPEVAVLQRFVDAGVFGPSEVQLCAAFARLEPGLSDEVIVALAVAARGPRLGHVCVRLADVARLAVDNDDESVEGLPWPEVEAWTRAIEASRLVATPEHYLDAPLRPLIWDGQLLYLQRYFHHERAVAGDLIRRSGGSAAPESPVCETAELETVLDAMFGADDPADPDLQRRAARIALTQGIAVIAGGPGTGKTRTIARLLAAAQQLAAARGRHIDVALAAPTGKAAARMTEALHSAVSQATIEGALDPAVTESLAATAATTIHRLLGWSPGGGFRRDAASPLPHDLIIVDEASMVSLPLMASLLDAVRPDAKLVLVGDPFQLTSIEAGSVMSDVVGPGPMDPTDPPPVSSPLAGRVVILAASRRFGSDSGIAALATAVRDGDAAAAFEILDGPHTDATWIRDTDSDGVSGLVDQVVAVAVEVVRAAENGDHRAGLDAASRLKVLAATRHQPLGVYDWTDRVEAGIARAIPGFRQARRWYVGRPIIVTANDYPNRVFNGDVGLVVSHRDGQSVVFASMPELRFLAPSQLDRAETWWAMTIHKSQGSEFSHAVVSLPSASSPILSRELLYTALTRAREHVTIVGSEAAIRAAIERRITRASGLRDRLWPSG